MAGPALDRAPSPRLRVGGRRQLLGGLLGVPAGAGGVLLAQVTGIGLIFVSVPFVAVTWVGFALGWKPALWSYLTAGLTGLALTLILHAPDLPRADLLRLGSFLAVAPLVILLARGVQVAREGAEAAREAAVRTQAELAERGVELERAHAELSAAWRHADEIRARLEEVAEAIPEPLIVFDAAARETYANRAALRTFGRSFSDRSADEWARLCQPRDERGSPLPRAEWPQLRAAREAFHRRMTVRLPMSDRDLLIDVEGTPVPDGGCVLLLRDVGREVDERRRLSRFASFVAHELRNPLAVAKARIELAQRDGGLPRRAGDHGTRALESVDAAIAILERLELFSRAEAGRLEATREPFDVWDAFEAALERLRVRGSDRQVDVSVAGRPMAIGDRQLSEQAITNLLTNADRYSQPDAPIEVAVRGGEVIELRVADGGPGIADELLESLFRERVSSGRGLGLGLYLVQAAMQAQGGSVLLEERRPRAVFLLRWPSVAGQDGT